MPKKGDTLPLPEGDSVMHIRVWNALTVVSIGSFALVSAASAQEAVTYSYDGYGRLIAVSRNNGGQGNPPSNPGNSGPDSSASSIATGVSVGNFSFELPNLGSGYAYNPAAPGSSFTGSSGIAANNSAWGFGSAPDGTQAGFIQTASSGASSIALTVSGLATGSRYKVRFNIARRSYSGYGRNPISVDFNGTALGTFLPSSNDFVQIVTTSFQPTTPAGSITFTGAVSSSDLTSAIDKVEFTTSSLDLADESFEQPNVNGDYAYNPYVSGATFTGNSGVAANGSAWGFSSAPDGNQVAFIQSINNNPGAIALNLNDLTVGKYYKVTFGVTQRPGYGANPISVAANGVALGTFTPTSTNFVVVTTASFQATASAATITFSGGSAAGDTSSAIDAIRVDAL